MPMTAKTIGQTDKDGRKQTTPTQTAIMTKAVQANLNHFIMKFSIVRNISANSIASNEFLDVLHALNASAQSIGRATHSVNLSSWLFQYKSQLKTLLKGRAISLTCDLWTSKCRRLY